MRAGGGVQAIVPQSFEEAWRVAGALAASGMAPKGIDSQEQVLAVIMAGAEIGMPPFQALQSFAIINGRVSLWGDGMLAVVRKHGVKIEEKMDGEGDAIVAVCTVTRPDTKEVITRTFSAADAKKAGLWNKQGPWTQYPKRMLQMRARSWALRDGCADLLRGLKMAEEVQDYPEEAQVVSSEPLPHIKGAEKDALIEDFTKRLRATTLPEDIEAIMNEAHEIRARISDNAWSGLEHIAEQETHRVCNGEPPRPPEPSPFEDLKAAGLACLDATDPKVALAAWQAKARSKTKLALCAPHERAELRTLEKTLAAEIGPSPTRAPLAASLGAEK